MANDDDLVNRIDALITDINKVATLVKRLQIEAQDLLLRFRLGDQEELPFASVSPITDATRE